MENRYLRIIALFIFLISSSTVFAQGPGCPNVDAGADAAVDCNTTCVDLTASYLQTGETDAYGVTSIPYAPPANFSGLANQVSVGTDDVWSPVINLPFDFCFFGTSYNQAIIGSNGVISFDIADANGYCTYVLGAAEFIPDPDIFTNSIMLFHDINPEPQAANAEVGWEVIGTAPCRTLVVSFYQVPHYGGGASNDTGVDSTFQMVLYETTNVIDFFIESKPDGALAVSNTNDGRAVLGIQNAAGDVGYFPPGRNTGNWDATDEAWRFTPDGARNYVFNWYDDTGASIGTANTVNVCPSTDTVYTAEVVYTNCNGVVTTVTDDVLVTAAVPFTVDIGPDQDFCEGDPDIVLNADIGSATATYQWSLNTVDIAGATNPTLTVSSPNSGDYCVTVTDQGCDVVDCAVITFHAVPLANPIADYPLCDDAVVDGFTEFDLSTKDPEAIGAQTGVTVTYHLTQADADANTNAVGPLFTNTVNPQTIYVRIENTNNTVCYVTSTFDLVVTSGIVANQPADMVVCDDISNDGIESFDLTTQTATILGGQTGVTVSYHETQADADADLNPLVSPHNNTANPQTIYVRVEDDLNTACYETTTFQLIVNELPIANQPLNLDTCDDPSNDGTEQFDLESQTATVLGIQNPANFSVTYHETQADANANTNAQTSPYNSIAPYPQIIYVRIETNANTNCYDTTTFTLTVNPAPSATQPADMVVCDDVSNDGVEIFDLETQTPTILGTQLPADVTITYHESQADADTDMNAIPNPLTYSNMGSPQIIHVRVESNVDPACYGYTTFNLIVNPLPDVIVPTPLEGCDLDADGFVDFMLGDKITEILNGQTGISVTFYETIVGAQTGVGALADPYTNLTDPQTLFVRLENTTTSCFNTTTLEINVNPIPVAVQPTPLEVCDDDNDGFSVFDLDSKTAEILGGQVGLTVSYHETQANADNDVNAITPANAYNNIVVNTQPIYVRVEDDVSGCYDTVILTLIVNSLPNLVAITDYELCDYTNPGDTIEVFDLTTKDAEVANGQAGLTITYHETQADADTGTNAIAPANAYSNTVTPQIIYVRVENGSGCVETATFNLIVNPLPVLVPPTALEVCDDNVPDGLTEFDLSIKDDEIRGGNPDIAITYHETQADADTDANAFALPYTNLTNPQIIFVRGEDINTGCYSTTTLELVVEQAPVANTPTPLEFCDPDSDGFGVFALTDADAEVTGGDPTLVVTYHETMADADNNINPLASPYNNIVVNTQTIYVRVESVTIATNCATIVELQLIVNPTPNIADPPTPLEVCDDNADGFAQFDLTSKDTEILNGLDPIQYTVAYYETQANADAATNPITNPGAYTNITVNMQTIWVRVDDTSNGCFSITTLDLIVNPLPVLVQPTPFSLCDYNNPGDEVEEFTLEDKVDEILNGQTGITITFHETQADADTGSNPLVSPYTNITNAQTIYVRAANDITGCVSTITLDLRVEPLPSPATPTDLEVCDDDNDGFALFDLDSKTIEILNGEPDVTITYHETMADADNNLNALTSPYANIVAHTQTIYVRAANDITGCYTIVQLQLVVFPSPELPTTITDYIICDTDPNGFAQFDLTTKDAEILGTQLPADFILTYHVSQADADTGNNPIVNTTNYTNLSNPQTIYVRLVSVANGCVSTGMFDLIVSIPPVVVQPTPLELCDDAIADEITVFDLTVKDTEITGGNGALTVAYYETNADAQADTNVIPDPTMYTNTSVGGNMPNPQTLYVRVTDGNTGCFSFTTLTIRVLPNPTPQTPMPIALCDDVNTGDGFEVFDLTIREADIINGEGGVSATYYEDLADAEAGTNAIPDPTMYTNTSSPQIIYVRVTNDITGCYTIVELEIIVNPLPAVVAVTDLIECEVNTDGFFNFDLESKTPEVLNGQDPTQFIVTYHVSQVDADANTNALVSPYTNVTNPQQIFVSITNNVTMCAISTVSFNIEVQEGAVANMPLNPYVICDNIGDNDGVGQFDLTTQDTEVLGTQAAADYTVSYYETQADADAGVNPLPTTYENTSNPQVIYVRVDNNNTICYETTTLTLQVNPLPIFDIEDSYIICVNTNGTETIATPPTIDTGLDIADYSFEWTEAGDPTTVLGTDSSFVPAQAGVYTVLVTNNTTGCQNTDSTTVIQSSPPVVVATVTTQAFANSHTVEVTATGDGTYEFSLDGGPWVANDPNTGSYTFTDVTAGEHTITARDLNGCGESSDTVLVMDYPPYFTPNGDTYHDTWNIIGISNQPNAKIYIFDRYGKLLKQLSPTGTGWNGTYNGEMLPSNDYWFVVEYNEPSDGTRKEFKAHFTLKR